MRKEIVLTEEQLAQGTATIQSALDAAYFSAVSISYTPLYFDEFGESQGGWFVDLDKKTRNKLKDATQSWHSIVAISGDCVEDTVGAIRETRRNMKKNKSIHHIRHKPWAEKTVQVKLSPSEYDSLKTQAIDMSVSSYIQALIRNDPTTTQFATSLHKAQYAFANGSDLTDGDLDILILAYDVYHHLHGALDRDNVVNTKQRLNTMKEARKQ